MNAPPASGRFAKPLKSQRDRLEFDIEEWRQAIQRKETELRQCEQGLAMALQEYTRLFGSVPRAKRSTWSSE